MFPVQTMKVVAALHTVKQHWSKVLASRAESRERYHRGGTTSSCLGRHTCQVIGIHVKAFQASQRRP